MEGSNAFQGWELSVEQVFTMYEVQASVSRHQTNKKEFVLIYCMLYSPYLWTMLIQIGSINFNGFKSVLEAVVHRVGETKVACTNVLIMQIIW